MQIDSHNEDAIMNPSDIWRKMKSILCPGDHTFIVIISNCQGSRVSQLEATNEHYNQVSFCWRNLRNKPSHRSKATQESKQVQKGLSGAFSSPSPLRQRRRCYYPTNIFHVLYLVFLGLQPLICDPNDTTDGEIWIDNKNYSIVSSQ
jgi:hypothetical protein